MQLYFLRYRGGGGGGEVKKNTGYAWEKAATYAIRTMKPHVL